MPERHRAQQELLRIPTIRECRFRGMDFCPHADITRAEMAVALVALLDHTPGVALKRETMGVNSGLYAPGST